MHEKTALPTQMQLVDENADLRARLNEAEDTLRAIRSLLGTQVAPVCHVRCHRHAEVAT